MWQFLGEMLVVLIFIIIAIYIDFKIKGIY